MCYVFTGAEALHMYHPIVTMQKKGLPPPPTFFLFKEVSFQKVKILPKAI